MVRFRNWTCSYTCTCLLCHAMLLLPGTSNMAWHGMAWVAWHGMTQQDIMAWHGMAWHGIAWLAWHSMAWHGMAWFHVILRRTVLCHGKAHGTRCVQGQPTGQASPPHNLASPTHLHAAADGGNQHLGLRLADGAARLHRSRAFTC